MNPPVIKVEIIHIEGSLKGTIQEFYDPVITIGRHPDCHVCFPKDQTAISRQHAEIRREGNRFMAIDQSTNGTLVNGKPIQEYFLKSGDVLTISEDGPKISFLMTIQERGDAGIPERSVLKNPVPVETEPASEPTPIPTLGRNFYPEQNQVSSQSNDIPLESIPQQPEKQVPKENFPTQTLQKPFIIQLGAVIKSFNSLPIILGSASDADFIINHSSILDHHLQIFLQDQNYHIKDLTGRNLVLINGKAAGDNALMPPDVCIALSDSGPLFQFLGDGRLAEIEAPAQADTPTTDAGNKAEKPPKSFWSFGKK